MHLPTFSPTPVPASARSPSATSRHVSRPTRADAPSRVSATYRAAVATRSDRQPNRWRLK